MNLTGVRQPEYFDFDAWKKDQLSSIPMPMSTPTPLSITGAPTDSTNTVSPVPTLPLSNEYTSMLDSLNPPTKPIVFQPPVGETAQPAQVADEPAKYDAVGREVEGERKFAVPSGESQDAFQSQESIQPQYLEDTQTQSNYSSQSTIYNPKDVGEFDKAISSVKTAQEGISSIMKGVENDPEIKKQIGKIASTSMSLEDMLDPNSESFKSFTENVNKAKAEMEKSEKDLADFQKEAKVSPDRYMREMPSTKKSMLAIATLLEGAGAIMAAQGGMMLPTGVISKQLQDGINRDIALQKDELNSKEKGLTTEANRFAKNLALLKDDRSAELKTKADMLTASKMSLENLRAKYQDKLNSAEADKITAGLDMELAKTKLELNKRLVSNSVQTSTKKIPIAQDYKGVKEQAEAQKAMKELEETDVPIFSKYKVEAYSKDEAKGLREELNMYENIMGTLETMKMLESGEGYAMYGTDAGALGAALKADFLLTKKNLEKLGVLSESDKDIIDDLLADPTSHAFKSARAKIENQIHQATGKIVASLNSKTKVGKTRFLDKDLSSLVEPIAKKRATAGLNRVLEYSKNQAPQTPVTNRVQTYEGPKINK